MTDRLHPFAISRRAHADLLEAIAYIQRDSPQNASAVERAIRHKIEQLQRFPESAPVDPDGPVPPGGATARVAHVSGFVVRYVFPLRRAGREVLYVVSIQRASRPPLDDHEYTIRFLQEAAAAYARVETHQAPSELEPWQELAAAERWQFQQAWASWQRIEAGKDRLIEPLGAARRCRQQCQGGRGGAERAERGSEERSDVSGHVVLLRSIS